ncbi:MAG: AAA family ATPase [Pseudomonadales bacterium]|nr:AAA family ATPase [Pseudomonadales bacterium]
MNSLDMDAFDLQAHGPKKVKTQQRDIIKKPESNAVIGDFIGTGDNLGLPDKLAFLASYGELFVAIVGDKGNGKSLLMQCLVAELDGLCPSALFEGEGLESADILPHLGQCFKLRNHLKRRPVGISSLAEYAENLTVQGKRPVIIVDNAHKITDSVLKNILIVAEKTGLGLVLFGAQALLKRRSYKAFARRFYCCQLDRLSNDELRSYIQRRSDENIQLSESQLDDILYKSEGLPQRVDKLVDDLLEVPDGRLGLPLMHMSVLVVLGLVLIGVWIFDDGAGLENDITSLSKLVGFVTAPDRSAVVDKKLPEPVKERGVIDLMTDGETDEADLDYKRAAKEPENIEQTGNEARRLAELSLASPTVEFIVEPANAGQIGQNSSQLGSTAVVEGDTGNTDVLGLLSLKKNIPPINPPVDDAIDGTVDGTVVGTNVGITNDTTDAAVAVVLANKTPARARQKNWILSAKATDYTLQLMGSYSEDRVLEFIKSQPDSEQFAYFETLHRNAIWFVLTVGQYQNRQQALDAIVQLPDSLRAQEPWARSVASIRAALN